MGGGAGVVLLVLLFTVSSAFAQSGRYVDVVNGADTNACTVNNPCTLSRAWGQQTDGDTFYIRVRRAGGTVQVPAPATSLTKKVIFAVYAKGGDENAVEGTLEFTGNFKIAPEGQFSLDKKAKAQFEDVTLDAGNRSRDFFDISSEGNPKAEQFAITGTLTIPDGEEAVLQELIVSKSFTVKGAASKFRIRVRLVVERGATLRIDDVDVYFHQRRTGGRERDILTVDGAIEDVTKETRRPLRIAALNTSDDVEGRGTSGSYNGYIDYTPEDGVTTDDCIPLRGSGTLNAGILVVAMGNVCVEDLTQIGAVTVSGSLASDAFSRYEVTTDLIFRKEIIVNGDVAQWNDSRILFEQATTIRGNVILQDGGIPYDATETFGTDGATLGAGNTTTGIRKGTQLFGGQPFSCAYVPVEFRRSSKYQDHIPGIHFSGTARITGDLDVRSNTLTNGDPSTTEGSAPQCAPRVLFMAPLAKTSGDREIALTSSVGGDLAVEDTASFFGTGRVYLDTDSLKTGTVVRKTIHNLRVGGDLAARDKTIGMAYPTTSNVDGMCTANDTSLAFGNRLVLTDAGKSVIIGDATLGLTLGALVTLGDLRVEPGKGTLKVKTLHVGPDAELTANKDVTVTESLILQGELSGELDESSTIKTLTYGNRNTDLVKKAALHTTLEALSVQVGSGELRLEEVIKTKNLGLCSGTLSLVDAESTTDSTLHITEQVTVQNGMLMKDSNDPGSISTDLMTKPDVANRYVLKYITPGVREVKAGDLEWFDPRDVIVEHAKAEIMVPGDRLLPGKLTITEGKLMVDGKLTVGTSSLHRTASSNTDRDARTQVNRYSVVVTAGELHTENMVVHGRVTVSGKSKLMVSDGDLHMLGRVSDGEYIHETAEMRVEKDAMADLGAGTLMLGPEDTKKRNGITVSTISQANLFLHGTLNGNIYVPKGSKYTNIFHARKLDTVTFDGTRTPKASGTVENM